MLLRPAYVASLGMHSTLAKASFPFTYPCNGSNITLLCKPFQRPSPVVWVMETGRARYEAVLSQKAVVMDTARKPYMRTAGVAVNASRSATPDLIVLVTPAPSSTAPANSQIPATMTTWPRVRARLATVVAKLLACRETAKKGEKYEEGAGWERTPLRSTTDKGHSQSSPSPCHWRRCRLPSGTRTRPTGQRSGGLGGGWKWGDPQRHLQGHSFIILVFRPGYTKSGICFDIHDINKPEVFATRGMPTELAHVNSGRAAMVRGGCPPCSEQRDCGE